MSMIKLQCSDGHELSAYRLKGQIKGGKTKEQFKGGIVLLQEIFGLTPYIEEVAQYWAEQGFDVLVPSLFDRHKPDTVIDYSEPKEGLGIVSSLDPNQLLIDIDTAQNSLRESGLKVGVLGYCWGGGLAFKAACELDIDAAAAVYGTRLLNHADRSPKCPIQFHFAAMDHHYSQGVADAMSKSAPDAKQIVYPADHGFDRNATSDEELTIRDLCRSKLHAFFEAQLQIV